MRTRFLFLLICEALILTGCGASANPTPIAHESPSSAEGGHGLATPSARPILLQETPQSSDAPEFATSMVVDSIRERLRDIQRCYENELRQDTTLAGVVRVDFTVLEQGTVSGVRASKNTIGSEAVAACVVHVIRRFRFSPGPVGGSVDFSYPFVFAPQN